MASQNSNESVSLDDQTFYFSNQSYNYFGIKVKDLNETNLLTTELSESFILPNTEFKFDADLNGFEIHAAKSGQINISVLFKFLLS